MQANYFRTKSYVIFYKFFSLVLVFSVLFFLFSLTLYPKLLIIWQDLFTQLKYDCNCTSHFSFKDHTWLITSLIIFGLGLLTLVSYLLIRVIKIRRQTRKFIKKNLKSQRRFLSEKLQSTAATLGLKGKIIEIEEKKPIIFCYGYFRPKVCISSKLTRKLSESELMAVLQHEKYHLINHDPIKLFLVRVTSKILFFVPGLRLLARQFIVFSELAADESATKNFTNKAPLVQALSKIIYWHQKLVVKNNLAVSFFEAVLPERVNKLTDAEYIPNIRIVTPKLILNTFLLLITFISFEMLVNFSGSIISSKTVGFCSASQSSTNQCQMIGEDTCIMDNTQTLHYCQS